MRERTPFEILLAATAVTLLSGYGCNDDLLADPGFDMWCGEQLCNWEVERGRVGKAATWDELDEGAALAGPRVVISQHAPIDAWDADAICFSLLADTYAGAALFLELDFDDDGEPEFFHEIPSDAWELVSLWAPAPRDYSGVRFRVIKQGWDRGVIAQVRATDASLEGCEGALELEPLVELNTALDTGF
jgi:hypothetical protein